MKKIVLITILIIISTINCASISARTNIIEINSTMNNSTKSSVYDDQYENNNNLDTAYNLSPADYYKRSSYVTSLNATLDTAANISDIDIYYFTLLTNSIVSLNVNTSNSNYSFDLFVFTYNYRPVIESVYRDSSNIVEDESSFKSKGMTNMVLAPGTYFIHMRGQQPYNSGITLEYNLKLSVSKSTENSPDASIRDLRENKELPAALWVSDYRPLGNQNALHTTLDLPYYQYNQQGINNPDYALNSLRQISQGEDIRVACYYIWGIEIKKALHATLVVLNDNLIDTIVANDAKRIKLEITKNNVEKVLNITGSLIDAAGKVTPYSEIVEVANEVFEKVSLSVLNLIFDAILPETNLTQTLTVAYINRLFGYVDTNYPNANEETVVEIPIYYTLTDVSSTYTEKYQISFTRTFERILETPSSYYNEDIINSTQGNHYSEKGKIYGLKDISTTNINELYLANSYENIEILRIGETSPTRSLLNGEYQWFKFTTTTNGLHSFYSVSKDGGQNMSLDVFNSAVIGYSSQGLVTTKTGGYTSVYDSTKKGFLYTMILTSGDVTYFRVREKNYGGVEIFNFYAKLGAIENGEDVHTHTFSRYTFLTNLKHLAYCSKCSESVELYHSRLSNLGIMGPDGIYKECLDCHGLVKV